MTATRETSATDSKPHVGIAALPKQAQYAYELARAGQVDEAADHLDALDRMGAAYRLETGEWEKEAIHLHFSLSYANYLVLPRTLLQSMPDAFQARFVAMLDELHEAFRHVEQAKGYKVEAAVERDVSELTELEQKMLGVTEDWYRGEEPPEGLSEQDLAEWRAVHENPDGPEYYDQNGHEMRGDDRVLLPVADPVPHYNRGRSFIQPQPGLPGTWISPVTGNSHDLSLEYAVSKSQYATLLKGEPGTPTRLVWRHYGEFTDGVPVLLAVPDDDGDGRDRVEDSIKLTDYEKTVLGGEA